jgi:hypothetical protein
MNVLAKKLNIFSKDLPPEFFYDKERTENYKDGYKLFSEFLNLVMKDFPLKGSCPEVFSYSVYRNVDEKFYCIRMVFYEGLELFAISPNRVNLSSELKDVVVRYFKL